MGNSVSVGLRKKATRRQGFVEKAAKKAVLKLLQRLEVGHLVLEDGEDSYTFGQNLAEAEYHAHITVYDPQVYRDVFTNTSVGAAEAYMKGYWGTQDLTGVIRLMVANLNLINEADAKSPIWKRLATKAFHSLNANTKEGSRKNISAHYDLGNDFFKLFLDPTMMYSAAIYPSEDASLEEAAVHKLDRICQKLDLGPDDHLLEIGTGWGGMAIHAAQHYGCHVTTTTISQEQYDYANAKVKQLDLQDRITLLLEDYRDLAGQYDKLVSIEMIEAVGHEYLDGFFKQCSDLLKPEGLLLIQAITIADQRYDHYRKEVDFIQTYIFPGGCLPSVQRMSQCLTNNTDMVIHELHDIGLHYARTLADWREKFLAAWPQLAQEGFDQQFKRLWTYYLCYCEGGFLQRAISTVHLVSRKPQFSG